MACLLGVWYMFIEWILLSCVISMYLLFQSFAIFCKISYLGMGFYHLIRDYLISLSVRETYLKKVLSPNNIHVRRWFISESLQKILWDLLLTSTRLMDSEATCWSPWLLYRMAINSDLTSNEVLLTKKNVICLLVKNKNKITPLSLYISIFLCFLYKYICKERGFWFLFCFCFILWGRGRWRDFQEIFIFYT